MTRSKLALAALLLSASLDSSIRAQQAQAQVDPATAAVVRRLLGLTGSAQLALRGMEAVIPAQKAANPQMPAVFWDAFLARVRSDSTAFIEMLVPIYAAHLTRAELEALVRFYQSPLGKRLAEVQPLIAQESIRAGQSWGATVGREIAESLAQTGVKFPGSP